MINAVVATKIESKFGYIESVEKIGSGVNNVVYALKIQNATYALKLKERGLYDFFESESAALHELNGFVAPNIFLFDDSDPDNKFLLLEYIDGKPIESVEEIGVAELVALVSKIHQTTRRKCAIANSLKDDLKQYLEEKCYSSIPELKNIPFSNTQELLDTCDFVLESAGKFEYADAEHEVLIHGDLNVTNIIKDKSGEWRLLDWELARFSKVETEIAALIWAHCNSENQISELLNSNLCGDGKHSIALMTLARGLDVSTWRTKWIHSLPQNDEKIDFYHSELAEDWAKIRILKSCL